MADLLVLAYHAVSERWEDLIAVAPRDLDLQLELLLDRGYRGVTFSEALTTRSTEPVVAVTFDDGYASTLDSAFPVLDRLGLPGTVFVPSDFMGQTPPMSWPGIDHWVGSSAEHELIPMSWSDTRALADAGWEIGSHTCSHAWLPRLSDEELARELSESRAVIAERLGRPCDSLAYPYGAYDTRVVAAARAAGYRYACTLPSALMQPADLAWPRIGIYRDDTIRSYRLKVSSTVRRLRRSPAWSAVSGARTLVSRSPSLPIDVADRPSAATTIRLAADGEPVVDVGIPVFGRPDYVDHAIRSVLGQSLPNWRLTVSEDGPGDAEIAQIVAPYLSDPRITHVVTGERVGAARNMTNLVAYGTAPYVGILHDDDRWHPRFLERRVAFLASNPECGFVFSPTIVVDRQGREIERTRVVLSEGQHSSKTLVSMLVERNVVPITSVLVRRTAYETVGATFDDGLARIYDYEMWLRLAVRFPVGYLAVQDAEWRTHPDQSTRSVDDRRADFEYLLDRADELTREYLPSCRPTARERQRTLSDWLITNALNALEQNERQTALSDLRAALGAHPPAAFDVRVPLLLTGLAVGPRAARPISLLRSVIRRRGIEVHPVRATERLAGRVLPGGRNRSERLDSSA